MNDEIQNLNGRPFDPKWTVIFYTSNVIISILFGKNFLQSSPKDHSAIVEGAAGCDGNFDTTLNLAPFVRFLPMFWKTMRCLRASWATLLKSIEAGIEFNKS